MPAHDTPDFLASKVATAISWLAAFLGLGTVIGWVNLLVGLLSACWLAVQLWNYCRFTLPANLAAERKRKAEALGITPQGTYDDR